MNQSLNINEIFYSIEGEGKRAGLPCVFIRLAGCNLSCLYCDTKYASDNKCSDFSFQELSIIDIVNKVQQYPCLNVTITGGEPLVQPNVYLLISALIRLNYEINIETNGSCLISPSNRFNNKLFYTMDWKTKSSGESNWMNSENLLRLQNIDVLKFVVGTNEDLLEVVEICKCLPNKDVQVFVSPVYNKMSPLELVNFVKSHGLSNIRLQLQLHKIIWDSQERGV